MDISSLLNQKTVYWPLSGIDGYGKRTFGTPQELSCRWGDKQVLFIDKDGNEVRSQAVIYLSTEVDLGGYLYQGTEAGLDSDHSDPYQIDGAREIRGFEKIYGVGGSSYLVKVFL